MPQTTVRPRSRRENQPRLTFDKRLVLNRWMLHLFEVEHFDKLADTLKDPILEGFDEENVSRFHHVLRARLFEREELSADILLGYDQNIVRHWQQITEKRTREDHQFFPKYFQYLALLFTEIYLDRYFRDANGLLVSLNAFLQEFNSDKPTADHVKPFKPDDLNTLAFWQATGSGKTLLMHVNILQHRHYLAVHRRQGELNRTILLTPNEGLSKQHLREFELSGMDAELFSKEGRGLFAGHSVEIIDVHKLKEEMGEKTVAIDAFEGNNLVLVDEGHRGAAGFEWMDKRNRLCENGFSFEYSATFGQAIKAARKESLTQEYAKCILVDYSYKYFYRDGYGKDYHILNLEDDSQEDVRQLYLTACLLVFYQQVRLYREQGDLFRPYLIERPLWVFVGSSVNAVRTERGRKVSDVVDILLFLSGFVREKARSCAQIDRLLRGKAGLMDGKGHEVFANAFAYLISKGDTAESIFSDILAGLFNAPAQAAVHVENLKGSEGEIALRLGENDPFGVINVGDTSTLCKLCAEHPELVVPPEREFSGSLFHGLQDLSSTINVLIGSKKFTEGWNSWRVSTMGLMNVGRTEGSEIIQLFGRGVRLKGYDFCLKRSQRVEQEQGIRAPKFIRPLETLHIFGIRADYMRQFNEYLEEEGLPINEEPIEFILPVIKHLGELKLRMIRLKDGIDFKKDGPKPSLDLLGGGQGDVAVALDWYPKIQSARSKGIQTAADPAEKKEGKLRKEHLAFLDMESIFFELEQFKNEKIWHNLNLHREAARKLLESPTWYKLLIPPEELDFTDFGRVRLWQEIATALLKKYCDNFYKYKKNEYEVPYLEYRDLSADDPNFFDEYRLLVARSEEAVIETLKQIKVMINRGELKDVQVGNLHCFSFDRHLYEPLIHIRGDLIEVRPVALNEGERDFVLDLRSFHRAKTALFKGTELYLLRKQSRGKGIGFFEAGNFYPDFILWLLVPDRQYVTFVDPKGIRNLQGPDDPKIRFHETIKNLEKRLGDPKVILNSFVVSVTPYKLVGWWDGGMTEKEFEEHHIVFRDAEKLSHLDAVIRRVLPG